MAQDEDHQYEMRPLVDSTNQPTHSDKHVAHTATVTTLSRRSSDTVRDPATTSLNTTLWAIVIFIIYTALAVIPWSILCIMNERPLMKEKSYHPERFEGRNATQSYAANERNFRTAQRLQSIATLLTIPITTAICSMACVAYMQAGSLRKSLTLSQTMALADRGWLSPATLVRVKTLGSLPLYIAFALTLIGSIVQILQNAVVGQESILASAWPKTGGQLDVIDISALLTVEKTKDLVDNAPTDRGVLVAKLRELMQSPYSSSDDTNRWDQGDSWYADRMAYESGEAPSLAYVPLASDFTTGAFPIAQYAPRISSSISYTAITPDEFTKNCRNETDKGWFYAKYERDEEYRTVSLEACMPVDLRKSPWNVTRDRQDLEEELYLNILSSTSSDTGPTYWKASAKSSLGYFELPSEANGNTQGELLDKDPFEHDKTQLSENIGKRAENVSYTGELTLSAGVNRGPLASVALALFGRWSFVESRMSNASKFVHPREAADCVYRSPLSSWLDEDRCIYNVDSLDESDVYEQVGDFLRHFSSSDNKKDLLIGLNNALFMANKLWLGDTAALKRRDVEPIMKVTYDEGIHTHKPKISQVGFIVGSLLLGAHLLGLLALAIYVTVMKPWSKTMGAEVMLKMGMAYSDELASLETKRQWESTVTKMPGFIGDAKPSEAVGELQLGALAGLSRKDGRKFAILK